MGVKFQTIFGAVAGFEYFPRESFEAVGIPYNWSFMLNLFFFRINVVSFMDDESEA